MSRAWSTAFRINYAVIGRLDPLITRWWRRFGVGNVVELHVRGRRTGSERRVLLGLLRVGDARYIGHPNGRAHWTRNLDAAGEGVIVGPNAARSAVRAVRLDPGAEREAVIRSTGQHPFPGDLLYFLGRRHIRGAGVFYRLEPIVEASGAGARGGLGAGAAARGGLGAGAAARGGLGAGAAARGGLGGGAGAPGDPVAAVPRTRAG